MNRSGQATIYPNVDAIVPSQQVAETIGKQRINAVLALFGSDDYLDQS
ncbi:MAG: hypothetical protein ACK56G_12370 [Pirellulaceae bacterium]